MLKRFGILSCALMALIMVGCSKSEDSASSTTGAAGAHRLKIAVIPKGTAHVFWKAVEAGARDAAKELDVDMVWKGALQENDRAQEIAIVEQFVSEGVDGIVLAPLDDTALRRPAASAMEKHIPVVIIDSALKGEVGKDFISFASTNNKLGGQMAGEQLAKLLNGKGKVVVMRYLEGSASTEERAAGFLEVMAKNPGIEVILSNRYAGATVDEAKTNAMNLLDKLKEADGIFCVNEPVVAGMLSAMKENGLAGKTKFVGFDASPGLLDGLKTGAIQALIVQDPHGIGYQGVKTLVRHIRGEKVPELVDTGVHLVTLESLDDPAVKKLVGAE